MKRNEKNLLESYFISLNEKVAKAQRVFSILPDLNKSQGPLTQQNYKKVVYKHITETISKPG